MAHAAKQIRDWAVTALDGYGALPTPTDGPIRQRDTVPQVLVWYGGELVEPEDVGDSLQRTLELTVRAIDDSADGVDALCVDIEKGLEAAFATFPGLMLTLAARDYGQDLDGDTPILDCTSTFEAVFVTAANDPETFI